MSRDRIYLTTAIPYVNARPHLGFALELVLTDALARYHRQQGRSVRFLTGTDENSLKNVRAARRAGVSTGTLVEHNARQFRELRQTLNLSFDDFIRTNADPRHGPGVRALWRACAESGDVYRRRYRGLYCLGCEHFVSGPCPEHPDAPETVDEENWFFRLERYQDDLIDWIESGRLEITPDAYRREVLAFARSGLEDFSISRSAARAGGWGIAVPGDPEQVTYVWFDALANYVSALGYGGTPAPEFERWWAGGGERTHVIGKGITRFHALYWPAILRSAGIPLPDRILVHGYLTVGGAKISKSSGVDPDLEPRRLVAEFGCDALRYHLLRHTRSHQDGDFSRESLARSYRAELGNQLGNLLRRVVTLAQRTGPGFVPAEPGTFPELRELSSRIADAVEGFRLHEALDAIFRVVARGNAYLEETEPWKIPCPERRLAVLSNAAALLVEVGTYLTPFLPETARRIREQLGEGKRPRPAAPLFPRLSSESGDPAGGPRP